ncbi:hypothetical protein DI005_22660 [Prauserella sp. PE36]|uniref:Cache domain-containing protein n=1 Tax=Prauserella endophytica TaxID=1592324 RepID=A0ABY2SBU6_9PSEU|nr:MULTISPECIES: cache domain-containing protein [Prauserella]PXY23142.1 hypothetical protein BAY59_25875 [Prauserella coralliicola]RBM17100.1 hypothetical protein DI005_22660 [Prauserella sp. PE36]TKG72465.1 hypothetical protein FCN18_04220 [Prauserella endophytica]
MKELRKGADQVRRELDEQINAWQRPVADLADAVRQLIGRNEQQGGQATLTEKSIVSLVPRVEQLISSEIGAIGAGFIAAPSVVEGRRRYMLWLQERDGVPRHLRLNFDTEDLDAYDYERMDWYTAPRNSRTARLTGPFLDYSGSDHLVVTLTVPACSGGDFLGVAGIDLSAHAVEDVLVDHLRVLDDAAVVFNEERLVIAANSTRWMPGERIANFGTATPNPDPQLTVPLVEWSGWTIGIRQTVDA